MVPIYEKHFTEPEIDEMVAFYQTERGKKMIDKMFFIRAEYMPIIQNRMKSIVEKIKKQRLEQAGENPTP